MGVKLQRPSVKDPRLIVGISLVIASIVGVSWVVNGANHTTAVYQVRGPIVTGAIFGDADVEVVHVNLGSASKHYISATENMDEYVALSDIAPGELIARSHVGTNDQVTKQPVPVPVDRGLAALLAKGDFVDIWWQGETADEPELVAERAAVWNSPGTGTAMGASGATIYVVVEASEVPRILSYQQQDGALSVLPVVGGTSE